jgi:hypothetical protein
LFETTRAVFRREVFRLIFFPCLEISGESSKYLISQNGVRKETFVGDGISIYVNIRGGAFMLTMLARLTL